MEDQLLKLPSGTQDYRELVTEHSYYVDKTSFLKTTFVKDPSRVLLITRPRRFGKSLTLSMFSYFLGLNYENPDDLSLHYELFKDRDVLKDKEFCEQFMGKFPVIFISFKEAFGENFEIAYQRTANLIYETALKYKFLQESPKLLDEEKEDYKELLDKKTLFLTSSVAILSSSLKKLTNMLTKHFGRKCILLVDEYDVPLAKASLKGYYDDMRDLMSAMYSAVLKDNDAAIYKAVVTGCLRVAKESIFTGVNNFKVNSIFTDEDLLAELIGFTDNETKDLLDYFNLSEFKSLVKENYDGYNFYHHEIYCSWDVVGFCQNVLSKNDRSKISAKSYWIGSSSNDIIKEFLGFISTEDADKMQDLVDGKAVSQFVTENMNHEDLKKNKKAQDFWSLLAYTGYLTLSKESSFDIEDENVDLVIPNKSILKCFKQNILDYFTNDANQIAKASEITKAIFNADVAMLQNSLDVLLRRYISIRDFSNNQPKEAYYQGFLNGLFSSQGDNLVNYASNHEQGDGYPDITFKSQNGRIGVVIEIKQSNDIKDSEKLALEAIDQIENKKYYQDFMYQNLVTNIYCYGICFTKKSCTVAFKDIKK